jgi:murein L,D-transpeptidase YafK
MLAWLFLILKRARKNAVTKFSIAYGHIALAAIGLLLTSCVTESVTAPVFGPKHLQPVPVQTVSLIAQKGMENSSPILLRIFKEESELEIWKKGKDGKFAHLKTYPICRWSGELGPKIRHGDRQAPEGFYSVTPELMNPRSSYHLSFDLGFPNEFDRAHGRTGSHLMVHGDCSSAGCYAMTDDQVQEIFALARESFDGGQLAIQVQAFPFRMTARNMARHRNNPHMAYWRMLKEGSDHFELTKKEPKVDVCEKRYVFDARLRNPSHPFNASAKCPEYDISNEIAVAVRKKRTSDDRDIAFYANLTVAEPVITRNDGGTHEKFVGNVGSGPVVSGEGPVSVRGGARTTDLDSSSVGDEPKRAASVSTKRSTGTRSKGSQDTSQAKAGSGLLSGSADIRPADAFR